MELIILMGLQGSGKSTFAHAHFAATTYEYVSMDQLRNNRRPRHRQLELVEEALAAERSVIVDNTNPAREDREPLIALGKRYNAEINGYYFAVQVKKSLERNKQRTGKAQVPKVAIFTTLKKLAPPSYTEGFARLFCVRTGEEFAFAVSAWNEDCPCE